MPSTKSFTLVKSTLFPLPELTPLSPSAGTWPWSTAAAAAAMVVVGGMGRRRKAKTLAKFITHVYASCPQIILTYCSALLRTLTHDTVHKARTELWKGLLTRMCATKLCTCTVRCVTSITQTVGLFYFSFDTSNLQARRNANICIDFWQVRPCISNRSNMFG